MGDLLELVVPGATERFEIFSMETELVKAYEDPATKKKMFRGVASSTTKDLHGDTITLSALQDMERSAVGLTMFLNHSYDVPGDVGGTITKAIVKQKGVDEQGELSHQLEIEGEVEEDNPEALKTWRFVQKGRKIGLSIGAMIPDGGAKRQKDGSYIIDHLLLLEVSFVGIPANPKSWVDYAASALRGLMAKSESHTLGSPTITLEGDRYRIEGSMGDLRLGTTTEFVAEISDHFEMIDGKVQFTRSQTVESGPTDVMVGKNVVLGAWDLADDEDRLLATATVGEEAVRKATVWVETRDGDKITIGEPDETDNGEPLSNAVDPDVTDASTCPSCGGNKGSPKGDCSNDYHSSAEPDVTDAKIRVIEIDTDDTPSSGDGQGASSSEPADGDTLATPEADVPVDAARAILDGAAEDELVKLSFNQLRAVALRATTDLVEAKRELGEEKLARVAAETQRDAVIEAAGELVKRTRVVIEKVANAPLPRKALLRGVENEFKATVESYYGEEFARKLAGK